MKQIQDIVAEKKAKSAIEADQNRFVDRLGQSTDRSSSMSTGAIVGAIERMAEDWTTLSTSQQSDFREAMEDLQEAMGSDGMRVNNLGEIPKAETTVSVNLQGIEKIEAKSMAIEGLNELMKEISAAVSGIQTALKRPQLKPEVTVNVPPVKIPEIRSPEVKVNVPAIKIPPINIPNISVPKAEVTVTQHEGPRIVELLTQYDSFGNLVSITDVFEDGSKAIMTGVNTNKIKVEYR